MRRYPIRFTFYCDLAKKAGLSCPKGRALYACNRSQMGLPWFVSSGGFTDGKNDAKGILELMKRMKEETAHRWLRHWNRGGHIRSLGHSVKEWDLRRRSQDRRRREFDRLRNKRTEEQRAKDHDAVMGGSDPFKNEHWK
jgi:hypothetical protein